MHSKLSGEKKDCKYEKNEFGSIFTDGDGNKFWYDLEGNFHREDGPAIEFASGSKVWRIHGKMHREDGPAVEYVRGGKYWYYYNEAIECSSQREFERLIKLRVFW